MCIWVNIILEIIIISKEIFFYVKIKNLDMANALIQTIVNAKKSIRNRSIDSLLQNKNKNQLLKLAEELELFRKSSTNLYHKVRASLFLFVIYRFYLEKTENLQKNESLNSVWAEAACCLNIMFFPETGFRKMLKIRLSILWSWFTAGFLRMQVLF